SDLVVAEAIRRERDPLAVRREARIRLARRVVRDAQHTRAVLIRGPDVAEIAERDLVGAIVGIARELEGTGRRRRRARGANCQRQQCAERRQKYGSSEHGQALQNSRDVTSEARGNQEVPETLLKYG